MLSYIRTTVAHIDWVCSVEYCARTVRVFERESQEQASNDSEESVIKTLEWEYLESTNNSSMLKYCEAVKNKVLVWEKTKYSCGSDRNAAAAAVSSSGQLEYNSTLCA